MPDKSDKFFGSISKSNTTEVRISRNTFKRHTYLDIREYYLADEETEEYRPSKKGITIPWEKKTLQAFLKVMLEKVEGEVTKEFYPVEAKAESDGQASEEAPKAKSADAGGDIPF